MTNKTKLNLKSCEYYEWVPHNNALYFYSEDRIELYTDCENIIYSDTNEKIYNLVSHEAELEFVTFNEKENKLSVRKIVGEEVTLKCEIYR